MADDTDDTDIETPEDLVRVARAFIKESKEHYAPWRVEAYNCYAFVAGDQWTEEDQTILREQLRPCITFNRIGPVTDAVSGWEVQNRQDVRYIPRNEGDAGVNEIITGTADWVRDECDAQDEESDAFIDTTICGIGCTETRMDYTEEPDGKIISGERVDPLEMYPDPKARKRNMSDGKRLARVRDIGRQDFKARWPDMIDEVTIGEDDASDEDDGNTHVNDPKLNYTRGVDKPTDKNTYRVIEYQWCELTSVIRMPNPMTGQLEDVKPEEAKVLQVRFPGIKSVKSARYVYKTAFISRGVVLENKPSPCPYSFTYKFITGKRDRNQNTWYGLVRPMMSPQMWANKFFSTTLHHMNTAGKGILAEKSAFLNPRDAETKWASADSITWLKDGGATKVVPKPVANLPPGLADLMTFTLSAFREVTGVNMELMGLVNRDQPGVLEYQRKQAGLTILASLFDSLKRYRKEQGRLLLHFITEYLPEGTLVRINAGSGLEKYIPFVKNRDTQKHDVVVDTAPNSPNQKESTWMILQPMIPLIAERAPPEVWPIILEASPLPESVVEKINKVLQQPRQPTPDPAMIKAQAEVEGQKAQMQMKAQDQQQTAQLEMAKMSAMLDMKQREAQLDMQIQQQKAAQELQIAREKADMEYQIKMRSAELDANLKQQGANDKSQANGASIALNLGDASLSGAVAEHVTKSNDTLAKALVELTKATKAKRQVKTPRGTYTSESVD